MRLSPPTCVLKARGESGRSAIPASGASLNDFAEGLAERRTLGLTSSCSERELMTADNETPPDKTMNTDERPRSVEPVEAFRKGAAGRRRRQFGDVPRW